MAVLKKKKIIKKKITKVRKTPIKRVVRKNIKKVVSKAQAQVLRKKALSIVKKFVGNPIFEPSPNSSWEGEAVFNPAAVVHNGRVHLFYRALGYDGISRFGYASSKDGIHFNERCHYPVFIAENVDD